MKRSELKQIIIEVIEESKVKNDNTPKKVPLSRLDQMNNLIKGFNILVKYADSSTNQSPIEYGNDELFVYAKKVKDEDKQTLIELGFTPQSNYGFAYIG